MAANLRVKSLCPKVPTEGRPPRTRLLPIQKFVLCISASRKDKLNFQAETIRSEKHVVDPPA